MVEPLKRSYEWLNMILKSLGLEVGLIGLILAIGNWFNAIPIHLGGYPIVSWYFFLVGIILAFGIGIKLILFIVKKLKETWKEIKNI